MAVTPPLSSSKSRWRPSLLGLALTVALAVLLAVAVLARESTAPAPTGALPTAPAPTGALPPGARSSATTLWAVGDAATRTAPAREVARLVASRPPDRLLYLGDVYEDGESEEFARYYEPLYGALRGRTLPTPGNHDWRNHEEGYDPFWRLPHHYSVRLGGWQIISLNSEDDLDADSEQGRWLASAAAGPGTCRLAFWHKPRYSAGKHGDQDQVAPLWDALGGRAAIVVNGHDHGMQRLRPRDGIVELVSGAGGASLYPLRHEDPRLAWADNDHYGALRLELRPGRAYWSFISASGERLDSGQVRCRPLE